MKELIDKNGNAKITDLLRGYFWNVCCRHHDYRDMKDYEAFILEIRGLEYRMEEQEKTEKGLSKRLAEKSIEIDRLNEELEKLKEEQKEKAIVFQGSLDEFSVRHLNR